MPRVVRVGGGEMRGRRVVVGRRARQQAAVGGERARRAAQAARAAGPVHARAAPLARHVPEPAHQQRRRAAPRHRVPHLHLYGRRDHLS